MSELLYTEDERNVFGPFDRGDGVPVFADPLAVYRRLVLDTAGEHNELIAALKAEEEQVRLYAEERLLGPARKALGLFSFDSETGSGSTDRQTLDLLTRYTEYMDQKKSSGSL